MAPLQFGYRVNMGNYGDAARLAHYLNNRPKFVEGAKVIPASVDSGDPVIVHMNFPEGPASRDEFLKTNAHSRRGLKLWTRAMDLLNSGKVHGRRKWKLQASAQRQQDRWEKGNKELRELRVNTKSLWGVASQFPEIVPVIREFAAHMPSEVAERIGHQLPY